MAGMLTLLSPAAVIAHKVPDKYTGQLVGVVWTALQSGKPVVRP